MRCGSCGAELAPGSRFCPKCGAQTAASTSTRVCARCGSEVRAGTGFCAKCGSPVPAPPSPKGPPKPAEATPRADTQAKPLPRVSPATHPRRVLFWALPLSALVIVAVVAVAWIILRGPGTSTGKLPIPELQIADSKEIPDTAQVRALYQESLKNEEFAALVTWAKSQGYGGSGDPRSYGTIKVDNGVVLDGFDIGEGTARVMTIRATDPENGDIEHFLYRLATDFEDNAQIILFNQEIKVVQTVAEAEGARRLQVYDGGGKLLYDSRTTGANISALRVPIGYAAGIIGQAWPILYGVTSATSAPKPCRTGRATEFYECATRKYGWSTGLAATCTVGLLALAAKAYILAPAAAATAGATGPVGWIAGVGFGVLCVPLVALCGPSSGDDPPVIGKVSYEKEYEPWRYCDALNHPNEVLVTDRYVASASVSDDREDQPGDIRVHVKAGTMQILEAEDCAGQKTQVSSTAPVGNVKSETCEEWTICKAEADGIASCVKSPSSQPAAPNAVPKPPIQPVQTRIPASYWEGTWIGELSAASGIRGVCPAGQTSTGSVLDKSLTLNVVNRVVAGQGYIPMECWIRGKGRQSDITVHFGFSGRSDYDSDYPWQGRAFVSSPEGRNEYVFQGKVAGRSGGPWSISLRILYDTTSNEEVAIGDVSRK